MCKELDLLMASSFRSSRNKTRRKDEMELTSFWGVKYRDLCCVIVDSYLDYLAVFCVFWLIWVVSISHVVRLFCLESSFSSEKIVWAIALAHVLYC